MRKLQADLRVDRLDEDMVLLRVRSATGEEFGIELSPERVAALRAALAPPPAEPVAPVFKIEAEATVIKPKVKPVSGSPSSVEAPEGDKS